MEISEQIRAAMLLCSMSVQQLARAVGVSNQTVRKWLSGDMAPSRRHLPDVERVLGIRIDMSAGQSNQIPLTWSRVFTGYPELSALLRMPADVRNALLLLVRVVDSKGPSLGSAMADAALDAALKTLAVASAPAVSEGS